MVADIFYPIFNLKITVLVCFIQKKLGTSPQSGHLPEPPGGLTAPPIPQAAKKKNKKKNGGHISFLDYPLLAISYPRFYLVNLALFFR